MAASARVMAMITSHERASDRRKRRRDGRVATGGSFMTTTSARRAPAARDGFDPHEIFGGVREMKMKRRGQLRKERILPSKNRVVIQRQRDVGRHAQPDERRSVTRVNDTG